MEIPGSKIVVTGASGNLGAGMCDYFCALGAEVVGLDLRSSERSLPKNFEFVSCDLTNETEVSQVFTKIGELDILINLAGQLHSRLVFSPFEQPQKLPVNEWQSVIDSNLRTCFVAGSVAIEQMISRRKRGLLINISSIMAKGEVGQSAYAAAKAGVEAMSLVWAKELGSVGIRSVAVAPGFFDTDSTSKALSGKKIDEVVSEIPSNRLGQTFELYRCIDSVIQNDYMNGTVITLDGGVSLA